MLVKDVIIKACDFIDNDSLSELLKNNLSLSDELQDMLNKLIKCFNLVRNEIASEYLPIVKIDVVRPSQNKIELTALSSKLLEVISIRDSKGHTLKYEIREDGIYLNSNEKVLIKYNSIPQELDLSGEFNSFLPERVFAYGIVKEYYFMQTLYEDAKIWDERFKNSLQIIERKKSETIIPRRRWI